MAARHPAEAHGTDGLLASHRDADAGGPAARRRAVGRHRRRAVQHLAGLRRRGDPQGVPPGLAPGSTPTSRCTRALAAAGSRHVAQPARLASRAAGPTPDGDPVDGEPGDAAGRSCATPPTAGSWRKTSVRDLLRRGRPARRRGRRRLRRRGRTGSARRPPRCTPTWPRRCPPACSAPASWPRWPTAMQRAARRRAGGRGARAGAVRRRAARERSTTLAARDEPRAGAADPRRLPPRPGAAHARTAGCCSTSRASRPRRWPSGAALDSPLRDVAGHAALVRLRGPAPARRPPGRRRSCEYRADEWATRNRDAFCDGYAERRRPRPARRRRCCCARSRPTRRSTRSSTRPATGPRWLPIPLAADRAGSLRRAERPSRA